MDICLFEPQNRPMLVKIKFPYAASVIEARHRNVVRRCFRSETFVQIREVKPEETSVAFTLVSAEEGKRRRKLSLLHHDGRIWWPLEGGQPPYTRMSTKQWQKLADRAETYVTPPGFPLFNLIEQDLTWPEKSIDQKVYRSVKHSTHDENAASVARMGAELMVCDDMMYRTGPDPTYKITSFGGRRRKMANLSVDRPGESKYDREDNLEAAKRGEIFRADRREDAIEHAKRCARRVGVKENELEIVETIEIVTPELVTADPTTSYLRALRSRLLRSRIGGDRYSDLVEAAKPLVQTHHDENSRAIDIVHAAEPLLALLDIHKDIVKSNNLTVFMREFKMACERAVREHEAGAVPARAEEPLDEGAIASLVA
jgi:hypothetical protein